MKSSHTKTILLISLLAVGALVLAGCTPAAPKPTQTPLVTVVPATEVPATEVPATEVPATEIPVVVVPEAEVPEAEVLIVEVEATGVPEANAMASEAPMAGAMASEQPASEEEEQPVILTLEQLAEYDGKDGKKAYVAVDNIIYDVTDSRAWGAGMHNGFAAGKDLTREIKEQSPHGVGNMERVPVVGRLSQGVDLSREQLAEFTGEGDKKAYVAVNGVIYDVTDNEAWTEGSHKGFNAGTEMSQGLMDSPHGAAVLENLPVVGILVD
jgi:predicted heme/steroid binding protein